MSGEGGAREVVVDARGHRCPAPTLRLRRALEAAPAGGRVILLADDPMAKIDVPHFLTQTGDDLMTTGEESGVLRFEVRKASSAAGAGRGPRRD